MSILEVAVDSQVSTSKGLHVQNGDDLVPHTCLNPSPARPSTKPRFVQ